MNVDSRQADTTPATGTATAVASAGEVSEQTKITVPTTVASGASANVPLVSVQVSQTRALKPASDCTSRASAVHRLASDQTAMTQALQAAENEGWKIPTFRPLQRRSPPRRPGVRQPLGSR